MNPVIFRRCLSHELNSFLAQDADSLIFIEDWNVIYKTTGKFQPLARYSDVQSGFADFADLELKVASPVIGKIYLTNDSKIYYYDNNEWKSITAQVDLSQFDAILDEIKDNVADLATKVTNLDSDLDMLDTTVSTMSNDVNKAISDSGIAINKAEANKIEIDTLKGKLPTIESNVNTLKTDVDNVEATLSTLQSSDGKFKNNSTDTAGYLEDKINNDTLAIKYNKLIVKSIDGMTVGTAELNQLSGVTSNVQVQLNDLAQSISASSSGMSFLDKFPTKADLDNYPTPSNGMLAVVLDDGNKNKVLYIYSETNSSWQDIGAFEFSDTFTGLRDTPSTYEDGKFLKSDGSQLVYATVKYSELQGKPSSAVSKIDQAVADSHTHANDAVLDKFSEDANGNVLYANKELATNLTWTAFEF